MYSIAAIVNGKNSEDAVTIHRRVDSAEKMHKILDAVMVLGAYNISVVNEKRV